MQWALTRRDLPALTGRLMSSGAGCCPTGKARRHVHCLQEYFVRCITSTDSGLAEDWNYVDIEWADGTTVEVKCSAHLQPKREGKLVRMPPSFYIGKKIWAYSNRKGDWLPKPDEPKRWADIYVLCLEKETDPDSYNPLDLSQWEAFVIPTSKLDKEFPDQKTVSVSRLLQ